MSLDDSILFVTVRAPGPETRLARNTKHLGITARTSRIGPVNIRFSQVEIDLLEKAAGIQGIQRHHLIRQAALSVAEAIVNGGAGELPYSRTSDGYRRR